MKFKLPVLLTLCAVPFAPAFAATNASISSSDTVVCDDANIGDTIEVNGQAYLVVDDTTIREDEVYDHIVYGSLLVCTSHVTDLSALFESKVRFNRPIGNWDTSNVTTMRSMFAKATHFDQPIGNWDTHNVLNMAYLFHAARGFDQPIGRWDTSNVVNMYAMFAYALAFNQPNGDWNTAKVHFMSEMFAGASSFEHSIWNWDFSNVAASALIGVVTG